MPPRSSRATRGHRKKTEEGAPRRKGAGGTDSDAIYIFGHALRLRMLISLNEEGEGSAKDLADRLNAPLDTTDYHLKKLAEYKFVEYVRTERTGNTGKKIFRAIRRAELSTEEWDRLPGPAKNSWMFTNFRTILGHAEQALGSGAFETHPDSPVICSTLNIPESGWPTFVELFEAAWEEAMTLGAQLAPTIPQAEESGEKILKLSLHVAVYPLKEIGGQQKDCKSLG